MEDRFMRFKICFLAIFLTLASVGTTAAKSKLPESVATSVGETVMVKLPGNPRAGYKWQVNKKKSKNLDLITVQQVGWLLAPEGRSYFFDQPSVLNFSVKGKAAGEAEIAFDYFRTSGAIYRVQSAIVKVFVKPPAKTRR